MRLIALDQELRHERLAQREPGWFKSRLRKLFYGNAAQPKESTFTRFDLSLAIDDGFYLRIGFWGSG
jgi:hypothetical protein